MDIGIKIYLLHRCKTTANKMIEIMENKNNRNHLKSAANSAFSKLLSLNFVFININTFINLRKTNLY